MIVRGIAMGQVQDDAPTRLLKREKMGVALINGRCGRPARRAGVDSLRQRQLGAVDDRRRDDPGILLLAAVVGVMALMIRNRPGRPGGRSSVIITAVTDSGGFFIFLGWRRSS